MNTAKCSSCLPITAVACQLQQLLANYSSCLPITAVACQLQQLLANYSSCLPNAAVMRFFRPKPYFLQRFL